MYGGSDGDRGYGMGWFVDRSNGLRTDPGAYGTVAWIDPDAGLGAYLVIEDTGRVGNALASELFEPVAAAIAAVLTRSLVVAGHRIPSRPWPLPPVSNVPATASPRPSGSSATISGGCRLHVTGGAVRELVGHVASGVGWLLRWQRVGLATMRSPCSASTISATIRSARSMQRSLPSSQAFAQPDIAEHVFQHPAGDMPGAQVLRFRVGDLLVHQWDLARAIGADETLDPGLVQEVWDGISPMVPMMATSGVFGSGPSGTVADDAPLQTRLLDAMGRRP